VSVAATVRVTLDAFVLDVALDVANGEFLVLVGPNGAGKSTLLRALAGLTPLDDGVVRIDDRVVDDPGATVYVPPDQRSVGMMFQDYLLFPHLNVLDNVAFGLRERGMRKRVARERAAAALARVGLGDRLVARPHELSGGQAQRVALARALVPQPALVLLDEPLAALDVQQRAEARNDLARALSALGGAQIMVTHDAIDALTLGDRIVILEAGRVVQSGTPDEIVARPRSPYVADLVGMNLYRGDAHGTTVRLASGAELTVADAHEGPVLAVLAPHAVVLHLRAPDGSARNVWRGVVAGMERLGDRVRVRIDGAVPVVAEITAAAAAELALVAGTEVWAAAKATEIAVSPA
jgi:molybdate transport system ATP-binding protein